MYDLEAKPFLNNWNKTTKPIKGLHDEWIDGYKLTYSHFAFYS